MNDPEAQGKWVSERQVARWCEDTLVGNVTREKLDKQRQDETNVLDMMQNTSIVYHPESLIEM